MQRTAQDWLVLTQLTHHDATAVGIVTGLQFAPQLLLLPWTGYASDHFDRRRLLMVTQIAMGLLALSLGLLTVLGIVKLWEVYIFAGLLGCAAAFDAPARQTFVSEIVGEVDLSNAVGLSSTSFNAARMIGPAAAGVLIAGVGEGWVFVMNAATYVAVLLSLLALRIGDLHTSTRASKGGLGDGFRYVMRRPDLKAILVMLAIFGTFGLNFPIYISTMSVTVFQAGASRYGLLSSVMAIGSVVGALLSARRAQPRMSLLFTGTAIFGFGMALAAVMPNYWLFATVLVGIGITAQTITTTATSTVQLSTDPAMRGRVMALLLAVTLGGTLIGSPFTGWVADRFGPRWALAIGATAGLTAALVGLRYLVVHRHLRLRLTAGRPRLILDDLKPVA
jgi:MFS family permease